MKLNQWILGAALSVTTSMSVHAMPIELITNGDFSGGLAGWTVTDLAGGSGSWFSDTVGTTSPSSGFATSAAGGGVGLYAVTDQSGPGTHALAQSISVAAGALSVIVSFDMFANDQSGAGPLGGPLGLDHTAGPNQHARVDLMTGAAGPFSTAAVDIVSTLIAPMVDAGANPNPFTSYVFDITAAVVAGGTFVLRFGQVDNQGNFQMGVDNVSVLQTVPEPATLALLGLALCAARVRARRA